MKTGNRGEGKTIQSIVLITPTRDRPEAFRLCERWIARQTVRDHVEWIVVDDGDEPITPTMGQIYLRRDPSPGVCTLPRNLHAGLDVAYAMSPDAVLIIEDDDWYAANYVEFMATKLAWARLTGENHRRYYHLPTRGYLRSYEWKHASLACTGFRREVIPKAMRACKDARVANSPFVDMFLWDVLPQHMLAAKHIRDEEERLGNAMKTFANRRLSIGIKGVPGRGGLGDGHDASKYEHFDKNGRILREWVGYVDAHALQSLVPVCDTPLPQAP